MTVCTAAPPGQEPSARSIGGLAGAAFIAAAASLYLPVIIGLARQWYEDPNAAYGCLVAGAAIFAIRQRRAALRAISLEGSWSGAFALAGAAALYLIGTLAADLFFLRVSLVAFCAATVWFVCGAAFVRALAVPLVLLLAAIPLPAAVVTQMTMPLQLAASQFAAGVLGAIGVDVVRDGNVLTLSYITLEVAEACSGMRSLVTLLALVAVYWGTCDAPLRRVLLLAAAALPVALAGNGLRVVFTALLASQMGVDAARGAIHDATGFVAFAVMCASLVAVHAAAARWARAPQVAL
jgi:exosortase